MFDVFTTREIAVFIWFSIIVILISLNKTIRSSFIDVLKSVLKYQILIPFFILILYSIIIGLFLNFKINVLKCVKDIILWVIFAGVPFAYSSINKKIDKKYFFKYVINNIKIIAILEFIVSNFTFKLIWELVLIPVVTFISMLDAVAETKEEYKISHKVFSNILTLIGFSMLVYSFKQAINTYNQYSNTDLLISFLIPIIYSIFFIPVTYLMVLYSEYEKFFIRLKNFSKVSDKQKKELIVKINFSINKIQYFNSNCLYKLYNEISEDEFKEMLKDICENS